MKFKLEHIKQKKFLLSFLILILGNILGLALILVERGQGDTHELKRNEYGEGSYEETIKVKTEKGAQEIQIMVEEQKYSEETCRKYIKKAEKSLEKWLEEQKDQKGNIIKDMRFPEKFLENPVQLSWTSEDPDIIGWEGELGAQIPQEGKNTSLICTLTLGEEETNWKREVHVLPKKLSLREEVQQEVQTEAEKINSPSSEVFLLPDTIQGQPVNYEKEEGSTGLLICFLSLVTGLGMIPVQKEREKQKLEKRKEQMHTDYPEIIEKLILLLRAGFSIRKAMERLGADYLRNKNNYHMQMRYAYEEIVITCREMEGGIYEAEAYERLGNRCGLAEYKVFSVLLVQNLRKGNQSILELLERESAVAGEERKRRARVKGEEASTKLLLPMVMQLIVVLIILMVPAFMSFV